VKLRRSNGSKWAEVLNPWYSTQRPPTPNPGANKRAHARMGSCNRNMYHNCVDTHTEF